MQQKMYVFLVKSLKFISVLNLGVFAVYIFCCGNLWVFGFISFATSFQARVFFNLSTWCFVIKHRMFSYTLFVSFSSKMEDAILLSTSLDHGTSRTWVFFIIVITLAYMCEMQMQAQNNASHDSVFALALHLHLNVLMLFTCVFYCSCI